MMIHVGVDVTGRTVFNRPFAGTTEIVVGWYMVAIAICPGLGSTRHDNHIVAGMFEQIGTPRFGYWLEVFVKIFMLVYMACSSGRLDLRALQQTRAGEVWQAAGGFIPIWPSRWMLPISAAIDDRLSRPAHHPRHRSRAISPSQHEMRSREGGI